MQQIFAQAVAAGHAFLVRWVGKNPRIPGEYIVRFSGKGWYRITRQYILDGKVILVPMGKAVRYIVFTRSYTFIVLPEDICDEIHQQAGAYVDLPYRSIDWDGTQFTIMPPEECEHLQPIITFGTAAIDVTVALIETRKYPSYYICAAEPRVEIRGSTELIERIRQQTLSITHA